MIDFDAAIAILSNAARPLGEEIIALADSDGRVLAEPVVAAVNSPAADCSRMDGYAVRDADLQAQAAPLAVSGESFPGQGFEGTVEAGCCVRIFTGAPVPAGADRVVMQEDVRRDGQTAIFVAAPAGDRYIRHRGSDFAVGDMLVPRGTRLDPQKMVAAAGADRAQVRVGRKPKLAILTTGDELVAPGQARSRPGTTPESVSVGVAALASRWGADIAKRARLPDDLGMLKASAGTLLAEADVVVITGGASVGVRDFAKEVFADIGQEILFSKVAIKPGKPVWLGRVADRLVLGLPGNPTSAMVTARLFLAPLLLGLSGGAPAAALEHHEGILAADLEACGARETFVRARGHGGAVVPLSNQDSGAQATLADVRLLIRRRPGAETASAGSRVNIIEF